MEKIKQKLKDLFKLNPRFELIDLDQIDTTEDPVRPELNVEFRKRPLRARLAFLDASRIPFLVCDASKLSPFP